MSDLVCPICGSALDKMKNDGVICRKCQIAVVGTEKGSKPKIQFTPTTPEYIRNSIRFIFNSRMKCYLMALNPHKLFDEEFCEEETVYVDEDLLRKHRTVLQNMNVARYEVIAYNQVLAFNLVKDWVFYECTGKTLKVDQTEFMNTAEYFLYKSKVATERFGIDVESIYLSDLMIARMLPFPEALVAATGLLKCKLRNITDEQFLLSMCLSQEFWQIKAQLPLNVSSCYTALQHCLNKLMPYSYYESERQTDPILSCTILNKGNEYMLIPKSNIYTYINNKCNNFYLFDVVNNCCKSGFNKEDFKSISFLAEMSFCTFMSYLLDKYFGTYVFQLGYEAKLAWLKGMACVPSDDPDYNVHKFWTLISQHC